MVAAQILHECVAAYDDACGPYRLEAAHWAQPRFESAMITLDAIVRIFLGVVKRAG